MAKKALLDAVSQLMERSGLESLTVEKIAKKAGVAKGSVYLHFRTKEDLLHAVKESSLSPLVADLLRILGGDGPPDARLAQFVLHHLTYFENHRDFFRVLLHDRDVAQTHWKRSKSSLYRTTVDEISRVVEDGMARGIFRTCDPQKIAAMLLEANIAMINQRLCSEAPGRVEDDSRLIVDVFLNGLLRGRKQNR